MNDVIENGAAAPAQQVAAQPSRPLAAVTPADLLRIAVDSGADLERLEKLMSLQERWEADQARKAFADDMARFKAKPLLIVKDKHVSFKTDKGRTDYDHATIGNVVDVIVPQLAEFGFSHRWDIEQREGLVIVTCVITHRLGHSQSTTLMAAPDASGGKNGIQSVISAKTYLERHTLLAATGAATRDQQDDDGEAAELRQMAADMRKPVVKRKMSANGLLLAKDAIIAGTYTLAEIEATHELTPEQHRELDDAQRARGVPL